MATLSFFSRERSQQPALFQKRSHHCLSKSLPSYAVVQKGWDDDDDGSRGYPRRPPFLKVVEREGAVETAPPLVQLRKGFSQSLLGDVHSEVFQQVAQLKKMDRIRHVNYAREDGRGVVHIQCTLRL